MPVNVKTLYMYVWWLKSVQTVQYMWMHLLLPLDAWCDAFGTFLVYIFVVSFSFTGHCEKIDIFAGWRLVDTAICQISHKK